jgi:hypothetical protein
LTRRRDVFGKRGVSGLLVGVTCALISIVALQPIAAHATTGCWFEPTYGTGSQLGVGSTTLVDYGGRVQCPDFMDYLQLFGTLYTGDGRYLDSFSTIAYRYSYQVDYLKSYTYHCAKSGTLGNEKPSFRVNLGYNATPFGGSTETWSQTYYFTGSCPLIRLS